VLYVLLIMCFFHWTVGVRRESPEVAGGQCTVRCWTQTWETEDWNVTTWSCWLTESKIYIL